MTGGNIIRGLTALAALLAAAPASAEVRREAWPVRGLAAGAEIVVDRYGLAHIYAASRRDAYFLQGYNVARDRLWQIDLWRKRGLGRLSASFGAAYVKQDRAARLFLYRGSMAAEWARYAPGSRGDYTAFVAGINAYVDDVLAGRKPLPVEFTLTGSRPERWQADDVVRIRSNTLVANAKQEVLRARVACAAGIAADRLRARLYPDHDPVVPAGLDPCVVTPEVLADYTLATQEVAFPGSTPKPAAPDIVDGSNNWVIAGTRTVTGRPILANDPHRALSVPSLRYVVHLDAPGLSLIGAGEPAVPGISFGHNADAAFGLTIFGVDQEDLLVYALRPGDPLSYRYGAGWAKMRVVRETIPIKGGAAQDVELRFTRHGPVIFSDAAHGRAFALRTVWLQPGASGYAAASWLASAKRWRDFRKGVDHWGTPPLNLVWADTSGTTGWAAAGLTPVRPNWDGLLPVPGDGRYEWHGFRRVLPQAKDPAKGWFATANEMNLPPGTPAVAYEWADRSRIDRIAKVIATNPRFSVGDAMGLQVDSHSELAVRFRVLIADLAPGTDRARRALALLRGWDGDVRADSVAPAIYELWLTQHLGRVMIARTAPAIAPIAELGSPDATLRILETRDPLLGPDPATAVTAILIDSLDAALEDLTGRFGADMAGWQWGRLYTLALALAIALLASRDLRAHMAIGPLPISGSSSTPGVTGYRGVSFAAVHGASVRIVMDVGAWDRSVFVNLPGQSADPADPHYRDFVPDWTAGRYAPLSYTRPAVDAVAERVIRLTPER